MRSDFASVLSLETVGTGVGGGGGGGGGGGLGGAVRKLDSRHR